MIDRLKALVAASKWKLVLPKISAPALFFIHFNGQVNCGNNAGVLRQQDYFISL